MKAFPVSAEASNTGKWEGMDLRDYFAAKAMQGIISSISSQVVHQTIMKTAQNEGISEIELIAGMSYEYADAMMEQRTKMEK